MLGQHHELGDRLVPLSGAITDLVVRGRTDPCIEVIDDGEVEAGGEPRALDEDRLLGLLELKLCLGVGASIVVGAWG
ncbi:hypothetical protein ACFX2H_022058 [Malus domestica]